MGPSETLDRLSGDWWIHQLRRGQRYTTDDVLVAWAGVEACPEARRVLDLGAGLGSVGLLALGVLPRARLVQVEVQAPSVDLARRTVVHNGLEDRVTTVHGDLREVALEGVFDLVLANPPYLPPGTALASPVPQREAARLELHGDIFDYARAAARALAPEGRFVFSLGAGDARPGPALEAVGLDLLARRDILFREGQAPTIALFVAGHGAGGGPLPPMRIRDREGHYAPEWRAVRRRLNMEV